MKIQKCCIDVLIIKDREESSLGKRNTIIKNTRMRNLNLFHVMLSCLSLSEVGVKSYKYLEISGNTSLPHTHVLTSISLETH